MAEMIGGMLVGMARFSDSLHLSPVLVLTRSFAVILGMLGTTWWALIGISRDVRMAD